MKIIIHQALCGENEDDKSSGFSLLKTTLEDKILAMRICPKTNLADLPSSGISWTPAVRGFIVDQHYLIIKTYTDTSPNVRPGRLFSHVLIIDKEDIAHINDISILFTCFESKINKILDISPIEYKNKTSSLFPSVYSTREKKVAQGIIDDKKNIIWIGQPEFEEMICKIWKGLDVKARCSLHFGIQFNPAEVKTERFNIFTTPENIAIQWRNKNDFFIIEPQELDITLSLATKSTLGNNEAKKQFENFGNKIESPFPTIENLKIWEWCIIATNNIEKGECNFADVKQLLLLICKYSNNKNKGDVFKQRIIEIFIDLLKNTNVSEILSLKHIDFGAIKNANTTLQQALNDWCNRKLTDKDFNKEISCISIISKLSDKKNISEWWRESVKETITGKFNHWQKEYAEICWLWLNEEPQTFDILFPFLPEKNKQIENHLIETFVVPSVIAKNVLLDIASFAAKKKWYKLHAVVICEQYKEVHVILNQQLSVDTDENSTVGFEYIANWFNPLDFISESVHLNDERLWTISGKLLPKTNFIERLDYSHYGWSKIICKSIQQGTKIEDLFQYPIVFIYGTLDSLLQGYNVPDELWEIAITNKLTNIYDYEQREKVWNILPIDIKKDFLQATATAYINSDDGKKKLENELQSYLNGNNFLQDCFNQNKHNPSVILHLFSKIDISNQFFLSGFIYEYSGQLSKVEAISLGKIISQKRWEKCAEEIYEKSQCDNSYKDALRECLSLLDIIKRLKISLRGWFPKIAISENEWWNLLYQTACDLFPKGPNDNNLWELADGKESELHHNTTGADAWQTMLKLLRNGGCTDITIEKLLKTMNDKYPYNSKLNELTELYKKI